MTGPCLDCSRFDADDPLVDERLRAAGFGLCAERPMWGLMARQAACCFTPSRFVARAGVPAQTPPPVDNLPDEIDFG